MSKKLCELCRERPATVPDRNRPGRLVNRVCSVCHGQRLAGDLRQILVKTAPAKTEPQSAENAEPPA